MPSFGTALKIRLFPGLQPGMLGDIPTMLSAGDPRSAREQLHENYSRGGGFRPFGVHQWRLDDRNLLHWPGDPPYQPVALIHLRDELVAIYAHGLVCVIQPDRSFEVARMD